MDVGAVVAGLIGLFFLILIVLTVRKMAKGELHEPSRADQLGEGESKEEADALEREALSAGESGEPREAPEPGGDE